jgi:hypothetical protein
MVVGEVAVATLLELIIHYDRIGNGASHVTNGKWSNDLNQETSSP